MGACHSEQLNNGPADDISIRSHRSTGRSPLNSPRAKSQTRKITNQLDLAQLITEQNGLISKHYKFDSIVLYKVTDAEIHRAKYFQNQADYFVKQARYAQMTEKGRSRALQELNLVKSLEHPSLIRLNEFFKNDKAVFFVFENVRGNSIIEFFTQQKNLYNDQVISRVFRELMLALRYLHSKKVIHRNIRPGNLFFDGMVLKIIDFSFAVKMDNSKLIKIDSLVEDFIFIPPEGFTNNYDEKSDIWTCGVILHLLLTGSLPFEATTVADLKIEFKVFEKQGFSDSQISTISKNGMDLVTQMLTYNPDKRPSADEILKHIWFQKSMNKDIGEDAIKKLGANFKMLKFKDEFQRILFFIFVSIYGGQSEDLKIRDAFRKFDKDDDANVDLGEFSLILKSINPSITDDEIYHLFSDLDLNGNGSISYKEFQAAMVNESNILTDANIELFFQKFDEVL
jgi:calcium-dependent protein kinase